MEIPCIPEYEIERLKALHALGVLDTPSEDRFDRLTRIAKLHFEVPIALVSLVDSKRQWFKSRQGLDASETSRDISFCGHAILGDDIFYIPDTLNDARFADNPLVTDAPYIRFYAGAPLHVDSQPVGTLCIIDDKPREFSTHELSVLRDLADTVEAELERTHLLELSSDLQRSEERLQHLIKASHGVIYTCKASGNYDTTFISSNCEDVLGYSAECFLQDSNFWASHIHEDDRALVNSGLDTVFKLGDNSYEYRYLHADGHYRWMYNKLHLIKDSSDRPIEIIGLWTDINERKATEIELLSRENRIRAIIDTVVDGIVTINNKGVISSFNPSAEKIFGYRAEQVIGHNVNMLMPEPFRTEHDNYLQHYITTGERKIIGIGREVTGQRQNGTTFPMELAVGEMEVSGERMFTGIVRDITERKETERQLFETNSIRKAILDAANFTIISTDTDGLIKTFNHSAERMLGYSSDELVGKTTPAILHDIDEIVARAAELSSELGQTIEPGFEVFVARAKMDIADEQEWSYIRKDGSRFPVLLSVTAVRDKQGNITGFLGIGRDLSEQKQVQAEIHARDNRIRAIVDTVVDGIIVINAQGSIQTFNPAAEKIFGYSADEVMGRNVKMLMPEHYSREHDGYLAHYLETRDARVIGIGREVEGCRKDERCFPMELSVSEMEIHGQVMFTGIVRDITERKRIEQIKNQFVSTVSHELRTPLTSIRGALGLVLGGAVGEVSEKAKNMLQMANRNSERLTLLINDILDLEKIESGQLDFEFKSVDLASLVKQAYEVNQGFALEHKVKLNMSQDLPDVIVNVDENRILQVFANLISNAIKYSPKDEVVEIRLSQSKGWVRISITDHGPGISEEFRSRIFQRFAQADSSDTREKGGTGLGLSITKVIIEQHGGHIDFESEPGDGATFYFELPELSNIVDAQKNFGNQARVLICEDNPDVSQVLSGILHNEGIVCDIAASAHGAKELLKGKSYNAMLLDLGLPDQHGLDLIKELKSNEQTRELPIIVVSALAQESKNKIKGDAVMVADWIQKPVDKQRLFTALNIALSGRSKPRVLHVEDSLDVVQVTSAIVEGMADYSYATSLKQASEMIKEQKYDLLLLDVSLPDGSGLELLSQLKEKCPVIVFSGLEVDEKYKNEIVAELTKSTTSNEQLLSTIKKAIYGEKDSL